jgi:hypothetical protein
VAASQVSVGCARNRLGRVHLRAGAFLAAHLSAVCPTRQSGQTRARSNWISTATLSPCQLIAGRRRLGRTAPRLLHNKLIVNKAGASFRVAKAAPAHLEASASWIGAAQPASAIFAGRRR